jgi:hypothetical protein
MNKTHVLVALDYLKELEDYQMFLQCLEETGVDNWEGYDEANRLYRKVAEDSE